jgi:hypothetical protein
MNFPVPRYVRLRDLILRLLPTRGSFDHAFSRQCLFDELLARREVS